MASSSQASPCRPQTWSPRAWTFQRPLCQISAGSAFSSPRTGARAVAYSALVTAPSTTAPFITHARHFFIPTHSVSCLANPRSVTLRRRREIARSVSPTHRPFSLARLRPTRVKLALRVLNSINAHEVNFPVSRFRFGGDNMAVSVSRVRHVRRVLLYAERVERAL
ncbi:hypothetical protein EXIGLDRAFT_360369 [Exidia glandulosa HHB12029]|uniref:Uncharacterized protein n=1 Tax=Exidia glandulosa HHB12029 TaxID=1314781 RepID=A0A165C6K0_EXIGL|nr:hypothetical protein EXIGLDRAFT_360369 [Exidia glandulosa HHB12029]